MLIRKRHLGQKSTATDSMHLTPCNLKSDKKWGKPLVHLAVKRSLLPDWIVEKRSEKKSKLHHGGLSAFVLKLRSEFC